MPRDSELDRLWSAKQSAWEEQDRARTAMNDAWANLRALQDRYGHKIEWLKDEHDRTFEAMKRAFDDASSSFEYGDHEAARRSADEGRELKGQLPDLVAERRQLIDKLRAARSTHQEYRDDFRDKKRKFLEAQEAFKDRQTELRAIKNDALSIAGVPLADREKAVVRPSEDGGTNAYFGGIGGGDGAFHGHYHYDRNGRITYRRDPFKDHGAHNYRGDEYDSERDTPAARQRQREKSQRERDKRYGK